MAGVFMAGRVARIYLCRTGIWLLSVLVVWLRSVSGGHRMSMNGKNACARISLPLYDFCVLCGHSEIQAREFVSWLARILMLLCPATPHTTPLKWRCLNSLSRWTQRPQMRFSLRSVLGSQTRRFTKQLSRPDGQIPDLSVH